jgi:hypothetical protein
MLHIKIFSSKSFYLEKIVIALSNFSSATSISVSETVKGGKRRTTLSPAGTVNKLFA